MIVHYLLSPPRNYACRQNKPRDQFSSDRKDVTCYHCKLTREYRGVD